MLLIFGGVDLNLNLGLGLVLVFERAAKSGRVMESGVRK